MKKILLIALFLVTTNFTIAKTRVIKKIISNSQIKIMRMNVIEEEQFLFLYKKFELSDKVDYRIFKMALKGYSKIENKKTPYLIIVDYTKPSSEKRFVVLNMETQQLEDYTYVAHGRNTGVEMAISFSNKINSYKSSLGFYLTGITYYGKYGYSLKIHGLEQHYNTNAYKRGVVIHGSDNSEEKYLKNYGFLGRTEGCPALPTSLNRKIIDKIKKGSVLFIFANDSKYIRDSHYIK